MQTQHLHKLTSKLLMDAFDVNGQWFERNTNRDSWRPNSPKMKIYQQADDKPAMLNDDLEK